jgi:RIO kinase 1
VEEGLIDTVVRQLMSGKEAMVYVVRCGDETRCAKIYKEANNRSFRQAVDYTENRKVKNSRQARAMAKGTRFGREAQERPGKAPRWTRCTAWPPPACACPSPTTFLTACC